MCGADLSCGQWLVSQEIFGYEGEDCEWRDRGYEEGEDWRSGIGFQVPYLEMGKRKGYNYYTS